MLQGRDFIYQLIYWLPVLSQTNQFRLAMVQRVIIVVFVICALVIGGGRLVYVTYYLGQSSPALNIPLAYIYVVIPLSGVIIGFYKILDVLNLRGTIQ